MQNYMHISIHTSQAWADTFISELNDTHVEAELRTKHIPPQACSLLISAQQSQFHPPVATPIHAPPPLDNGSDNCTG